MLKTILDYKIEKPIGKGAFSEVFLAEKNGKPFAVKLMRPPKGVYADELLQSLRYEFWVLKDLVHPHIIRVFDFGQLADGRLFLVEEFLSGKPLDQFCKGKRFQDCEKIFLNILEGLKAIHSWKILHGDIKPENIFVTDDGVAKILDFGLARPTANTGTEVFGTPATVAPEVILKQKPDARADLYSFAVTAYKSLLGKNPFLGKTVPDTLHNHLHFSPEGIGLQRDDVPPVWDQLLTRLLSKNPNDRVSSVEQAIRWVSGATFSLASTAFVGREKELMCVPRISQAIEQNQKLAVVATGPLGVGATRFLKEVFYRLIVKNPNLREHLGFEGTPLVLFLERESPPSGYEILSIELKPFSKTEVDVWLKSLFHLENLPDPFLNSLFERTQGLPSHVWDILKSLNEKSLLADADGHVTKTSLALIKWEEKKLSDNFNYLLKEAEARVKQRDITGEDELWALLEKTSQNISDASERLEARANLLYWKGAALIDQAHFPEAKECLKTAQEILQTQKTEKIKLLKLKNYLAYIELRQGRIKEAIQLYENVANEIAKNLSEAERKEIRNTDLGMAYLQAREWQKAYDQFQKDVALYEKWDWQKELMSALYNFAEAAYCLGKLDDARRSYESVLQLARKHKSPAYLLRSYNGLGNVLNKSQKQKEAILSYSEALEVALALKDFSSAMAAVQNRGVLKAAVGQTEAAISDLELSLKYAEKVPDKFVYEKILMCRSLVELGNRYKEKHNSEEARGYFDKAWHMADGEDALKGYRFPILEARVRLWIQSHDFDRYKKDFSQLKFYADNDQKKNTVSELEEEFLEKKKQEPSEREVQLEKEVQTILQINKELVGDMRLEDLLKKILSYAIELTKAELGVLLLLDKKGRLIPTVSLNAELNEDLSAISVSVSEKVLSSGKVVNAADAGHDEQFNQYASVMALNLKSILGAPIAFKGQMLGVLYLSHRYQVGLFDNRLIRVVLTYADQVGLALKNHQLMEFYRQASEELKDELEVTQFQLTKARTQMKSGLNFFSESVGGKDFVTKSPAMMNIIDQVSRVADSSLSLVIHGESGTGKEVLARYIHESSKRKNKMFMPINCGALPANLVESELFGHKRGAFTGADRDKMGLVEAANGGTLFLDEITDLPLEAQVKLLRVLQEKEVVRVGETGSRSVDIRVIAASYKNLKEAVKNKSFREDLYYRLAGMEVTIPSLRQRKEDIPLLVEEFLKFFRKELKKDRPEKISNTLMRLLIAYSWPGNIREVRNFIEVGVSLTDSKILKNEDLPEYVSEKLLSGAGMKDEKGEEGTVGWYDPRKTWKEHELLIYASTLFHFDYDAARAAASLGIGVATAYKWIRDHRLKETKEEWKDRVLPYQEGMTMDQIRAHVFRLAAKRHAGHPYRAAEELGVAPVTFYRWAKEKN